MKTLDGVSAVEAVAVPHEDVALPILKLADGSPVVVRCEPVGGLVAARLLGRLPGALPDTVKAGQQSIEENAAIASDWIEHGTVLRDQEGNEVRPAFRFSEPLGRSLPGRYLSMQDLAVLLPVITRLSGFGGTVPEERFPAEHERRLVGSDRAVDAGAGNGPEAIGAATGRPEGVGA